LVPLNTVPAALDTFDKSREIALYCKGGVRSKKAAAVLLDAGFTRVLNVEGGILRWVDEVDPTLPKY
jgi:rhodanese-related sulfurtransferase